MYRVYLERCRGGAARRILSKPESKTFRIIIRRHIFLCVQIVEINIFSPPAHIFSRIGGTTNGIFIIIIYLFARFVGETRRNSEKKKKKQIIIARVKNTVTHGGGGGASINAANGVVAFRG